MLCGQSVMPFWLCAWWSVSSPFVYHQHVCRLNWSSIWARFNSILFGHIAFLETEINKNRSNLYEKDHIWIKNIIFSSFNVTRKTCHIVHIVALKGFLCWKSLLIALRRSLRRFLNLNRQYSENWLTVSHLICQFFYQSLSHTTLATENTSKPFVYTVHKAKWRRTKCYDFLHCGNCMFLAIRPNEFSIEFHRCQTYLAHVAFPLQISVLIPSMLSV